MNNITGIQHVSVLVADTEHALKFYRDVLQLEVDSSRPDLGYPGAWLILNENQQIHLLELPNPDPVNERPAHGGRDRHVAFMVRDIEAVRQSLDKAGIVFTNSKSGRPAIFCRDFDGNALELIGVG